jgi:hypothetical protein
MLAAASKLMVARKSVGIDDHGLCSVGVFDEMIGRVFLKILSWFLMTIYVVS